MKKLIPIILLPLSISATEIHNVQDLQATSKSFSPVKTVEKQSIANVNDFKKLLSKADIESITKNIDYLTVKQSHIAALAHMKGTVMGLMNELKTYHKRISSMGEDATPVYGVITHALETLNANLTLNIQDVSTSSFDIENYTKTELLKLSDPNCSLKDINLHGVVTILGECPTGEVHLRLEKDGEDFYLTGLKGEQVNRMLDLLEELKMGEIFK